MTTAQTCEAYQQAIELVESEGYGTVSLLQEKLGLPHEKARQILLRLIKEGKIDDFSKQHNCGWLPDKPYKKHWMRDDIFGWEGQD